MSNDHSSPRIQSVVVVGGGSAGLLAALTLKATARWLSVRIIRSTSLGVIGVGEATTPWFRRYLHDTLGIDQNEFYRQVRPLWKLGNRLEWGPADRTHFNYPFGESFIKSRYQSLSKSNAYFMLAEGIGPPSTFSFLMDSNRAPLLRDARGRIGMDTRYAYHIENKVFVEFLERIAVQRGITLDDEEVVEVAQNKQGIASLGLSNGSRVSADLYVDASGFRSRLLGEALSEPFVSFADSLYCDTALTGQWQRDEPIRSYTTSTTMDHGWCWRTEFEGHVNRGYVFSSQFCSEEEARAELKRLDPKITEPLHVIKFSTGRRANFWVNNVAAVGNAAGFVEPLESTGLQTIGETATRLANCLVDSDGCPTESMRRLANEQINRWWEDIRGFLAVHFKFNTRRNTAFWQQCREDTNLADAQPIVGFYKESGPSGLYYQMMPKGAIFGYAGYLALLIGQRVPTRYQSQISKNELCLWKTAIDENRQRVEQALTNEEALQLIHRPDWRWH
ncbi:MAG: tryptophan 7-halogenase [Planctomycetota bacterium]|nr:tryptophan 7-halogenase [Planctomycetota bacterium]